MRRDGNVITVSLWHLSRFIKPSETTEESSYRRYLIQKHVKRRRAKVARVGESAEPILEHMKTEFNGAGWLAADGYRETKAVLPLQRLVRQKT